MEQHLSARSSWLLAALDTYERCGGNGRALLEEVGIDRETMVSESARVPLDQAYRVWKLAEQRSGDAEFGLHVGQRLHPTAFGALGMLLLTSDSVLQALRYLQKYSATICNLGRLKITENEASVCVVMEPWSPSAVPMRVSTSAFFAAIKNLLSQLAGETVPFSLVTMPVAAPDDEQPYMDCFGCQVIFADSEASIVIPKASITEKLATAKPELAGILEQQVIEELSRQQRIDFTAQVYGKVCELLPKGRATQVQVAQALNVSVRKLQFQLQQENTSYSEICTRVRRVLALKYIKDPRLSTNEIACRIGFANASNFCRTFRRWCGMSPGEYRRRLSVDSNLAIT